MQQETTRIKYLRYHSNTLRYIDLLTIPSGITLAVLEFSNTSTPTALINALSGVSIFYLCAAITPLITFSLYNVLYATFQESAYKLKRGCFLFWLILSSFGLLLFLTFAAIQMAHTISKSFTFKALSFTGFFIATLFFIFAMASKIKFNRLSNGIRPIQPKNHGDNSDLDTVLGNISHLSNNDIGKRDRAEAIESIKRKTTALSIEMGIAWICFSTGLYLLSVNNSSIDNKIAVLMLFAIGTLFMLITSLGIRPKSKKSCACWNSLNALYETLFSPLLHIWNRWYKLNKQLSECTQPAATRMTLPYVFIITAACFLQCPLYYITWTFIHLAKCLTIY